MSILRCCATVNTSLSPRPHMFITMIWSRPIVGASLMTSASACAGSSAGMMPSSRVQSWKASSASAVGRRHVGDAAGILQPGMLRPDAGIVEAGRDRVALEDLAVAVLQEIGAVAVQHAGPPAGHRGGVAVLHVEAVAAGLDADNRHLAVVEERMEQADGVGAAADRRDERVGQPSLGRHHLLAHLVADHRLEIAHHRRIGVRARRPCRSGSRCSRHSRPSRGAPRSWRPSACRRRR